MEIYMLEKKNKHKSKNSHTSNVKHDYSTLDDVINDALLLSDLRKPPEKQSKTDDNGQTLKKVKHKNLSPILFISLQRLTGKKKNRSKLLSTRELASPS